MIEFENFKEKIETQKNEFETLLRSTNREGIDTLLTWLDSKSDFYQAPSSKKYHDNCPGGLLDHSLNVYHVATKLKETILPMSEKFKDEEISEDQIIIAALLHDLCKVNYYEQQIQWSKDEEGKWFQYLGYKIYDKFPLGHGEKSVIIANNFIKLTGSEMLAIRWHMGINDEATHFSVYEGPAFRKALEEDPLVMIIAQADYFSSFYLEKTYDMKEFKIA